MPESLIFSILKKKKKKKERERVFWEFRHDLTEKSTEL
jgi:hypothetical protein